MFIQSFHPKVTSRKISEFHTECFPDIILSNDIGNTVVDQDPVFRHLIHITVFIQFFCHIKTQFRSFFAFYIKLQHTGNILSQIVNIAMNTAGFLILCCNILCIYIRFLLFCHIQRFIRFHAVNIFCLVAPDHFDSRLILLYKCSSRCLHLCHLLCSCPATVIKAGNVPACRISRSIGCLRTIHIAHSNLMRFYLKRIIRINCLTGSIRIFHRQFQCQYKALAKRLIRIRIWRHKRWKMETVMLVLHQKPAVSDFRSDHIFPFFQIIRHIKCYILDSFFIICPARIQLVISYLLPVDMKNELSQTADCCPGLTDFLCQMNFFSCIKRFSASICNPLIFH